MAWYNRENPGVQKVLKDRECRIAKEAMTNWRNYVRDVFAEYLILHPRVSGGQGETVEIDESAFVRRKYNRGRQVNTQWVLLWLGLLCGANSLGKSPFSILLSTLERFILFNSVMNVLL